MVQCYIRGPSFGDYFYLQSIPVEGQCIQLRSDEYKVTKVIHHATKDWQSDKPWIELAVVDWPT